MIFDLQVSRISSVLSSRRTVYLSLNSIIVLFDFICVLVSSLDAWNCMEMHGVELVSLQSILLISS